LPEADAAYLWDVLTMPRQLQQLSEGADRSTFTNRSVPRLALERMFEVVGVAAMRLSTELRDAHPDIPWQRIIGLRNVIAHEYDEIIFERLWSVLTHDVPVLIRQIEPLVPEEPA
jgi:uncharacterized protein with HEPN domain